MKSEIFSVIKKELYRLFSDKKMVFITILMPGLMIYIIYSMMGSFMQKKQIPEEVSGIVINKPDIFDALSGINSDLWQEAQYSELDKVLKLVKEKQCDVVVVFPTDFCTTAEYMAEYHTIPEVKIYYNSTNEKSMMSYSSLTYALDDFESKISDVFTVNKAPEIFDLATEEDLTGGVLSTMLPMLMMMFLFSACVSIGPESIAGEKERGTIATLLVTPINRKSIAIGKTISLSIIAFLTSISSFIGVFLSLPRLASNESNMNILLYTKKDYALLFLIMISTVMVMVSIVSVISAFAKNIKEASSMTSPLIIIIVFISLLPNYIKGDSTILYCIPLLNSIYSMRNTFLFTVNYNHLLITLISNILLVILLTLVLEKIFNCERLIYPN